jgi:WD40 repeat protein
MAPHVVGLYGDCVSGYVFISHAHADAPYAKKLAAFLSSVDVPAWLDQELVTGDRWTSEIKSRIDACAALVVLMSPAADESVWVEREIAHAEGVGKPVVPLLLAGRPLFRLAERQYDEVADGKMPSPTFVSRLRAHLTSSTSGTVTRAVVASTPVAATLSATIPTWRRTPNFVGNAFSPDSRNLAIAVNGNSVRMYDCATWQLSLTLHQHWAGAGWIRALAFAPNGGLITGGAYFPNLGFPGPKAIQVIDRWDIGTGRRSYRIVRAVNAGERLERLAISPDSRQIVTCNGDNTARIWSAYGLSDHAAVMLSHADTVKDATFSPDGRRVATASLDGTARIWDSLTGELRLLLRHEFAVHGVAFSPDGSRLATASVPARVWDANTGDPLWQLSARTVGTRMVHAVTFSANGQWLATGAPNGHATIWDPNYGTEMLDLAHGHEVQAIAFSLDNNWLATTTNDGTTKTWALSPR